MASKHAGYGMWTPEEDAILLRLRAEGRPYAKMHELPGRTEMACTARLATIRSGERIGLRERAPYVYVKPPKLAEESWLIERVAADGGFPVLREVELRPGRFAVALGMVPVVADAVVLRFAA